MQVRKSANIRTALRSADSCHACLRTQRHAAALPSPVSCEACQRTLRHATTSRIPDLRTANRDVPQALFQERCARAKCTLISAFSEQCQTNVPYYLAHCTVCQVMTVRSIFPLPQLCFQDLRILSTFSEPQIVNLQAPIVWLLLLFISLTILVRAP